MDGKGNLMHINMGPLNDYKRNWVLVHQCGVLGQSWCGIDNTWFIM